jgi:hypothetical protein
MGERKDTDLNSFRSCNHDSANNLLQFCASTYLLTFQVEHQSVDDLGKNIALLSISMFMLKTSLNMVV